MSLHMGFDLVGIEEIEDSIATHGDRFLERVYTARERDDSRRRPAALAARFAAKEATMKALRRGDEPIPWQSIEVRIDPQGQASLTLSDAAAALAGARGLTSLALSLVPGRRVAGAIVVAEDDA
jgi:holo-[acyl-carrier protein] synthase